MRKWFVVFLLFIIVITGFIFGFGRNIYHRFHLEDMDFNYTCQIILKSEDFSNTCSGSTIGTPVRVYYLTDVVDNNYTTCGIIANKERDRGLQIIIRILENEQEALRHLLEEYDSYITKRGDVLGYNELSMLRQKDTSFNIFTIHGRIFFDINRPERSFCTDEQIIELGRLLYNRVEAFDGMSK